MMKHSFVFTIFLVILFLTTNNAVHVYGSQLEGKIALKAYNNKYVCADGHEMHNIVANRDKIGPWEIFDLVKLGGNKYALKAYNGKYVCADEMQGRNVVADRDEIGIFETFELIQF
ncbi:hypothetical protein ACFLRT_00805 [Acidobacteriota bacterium]